MVGSYMVKSWSKSCSWWWAKNVGPAFETGSVRVRAWGRGTAVVAHLAHRSDRGGQRARRVRLEDERVDRLVTELEDDARDVGNLTNLWRWMRAD